MKITPEDNFYRAERYAHTEATVFTLYKYGIRNNLKTDFVVLCTRQAAVSVIYCVYMLHV